jgi:hypothetical protein
MTRRRMGQNPYRTAAQDGYRQGALTGLGALRPPRRLSDQSERTAPPITKNPHASAPGLPEPDSRRGQGTVDTALSDRMKARVGRRPAVARPTRRGDFLPFVPSAGRPARAKGRNHVSN